MELWPNIVMAYRVMAQTPGEMPMVKRKTQFFGLYKSMPDERFTKRVEVFGHGHVAFRL